MSISRRLLVHVIVVLGLFLAIAFAGKQSVRAACHPIPVTRYSPTGVAGCVRYGEGTASMWGGPGAARNDCLYAWRQCQAIAVQSLQTGLRIVVTPTMFCDCYSTTPDERIVDLDPAMVAALGLDPAAGLWPVRVTAVDGQTGLAVPDTALRP